MLLNRFSDDIRIVPILTYASGTSDRTSAVIDTKGYDGFFIAVHYTAIAAGAVLDHYLQHADAASNSTTLTSGADVAGTSLTVAEDQDNTVKYIDVKSPVKRFYQLVINNDATNATAQSAVAYLYRNSSQAPVTHATGSGTSEGSAAVAGEQFVSPISGTK